ncbi:hypothetical protein M0R04_00825 [Candidatus Dojkabacteria bacterium]|jgi:hypothetical protein|nr:hypothetical protein [Candidatus Dojkabacteria bacterium]
MKILKVLTVIILSFLFPSFAAAATPSFSLTPYTGKVVLDKEFVVDIKIDTKGKEVMLARAVLKYDPNYIEVTSAERNASLFCQYPEDEQTVDNDNGIVMIMGFCQSGVDSMYKTTGSADVFARIHFQTLKKGSAKLSWQFSGEDEPFMSVMMKDGSPTTNILTTKPKSATFNIVTSVTQPANTTPATVPDTGVGLSMGFVAGGVLLVLLGFAYSNIVEHKRRSNLKTVVVYGKK